MEHDPRPRKRVRLEHTYELHSISYTSSQAGILDEDGQQHLYFQNPPNTKFEQAGNHPAYETHHTVQYSGLDHQITTATESHLSSSSFALSAFVETPCDCNNGLSSRDHTNQVCFGMVSLLLLDKIPHIN